MKTNLLLFCTCAILLFAGCESRFMIKHQTLQTKFLKNEPTPTYSTWASAPPSVSRSSSGPAPKIVKQPLSLFAEENTFVQFGVLVNGPGTPVYQWQHNFTGQTNDFYDIPGWPSTNCYWIDNVQFTNVASFRVVVTVGGNTMISDMAHLSVFNLVHTNSTEGTAQTPLLQFTPGSFTCGGVSFNRGFTIINNVGTLGLLYGPAASPQYSPFQNSSYEPKVNVYTYAFQNDNQSTGVQLLYNVFPFNQIGSSATSGGMAVISNFVMSTAPGGPANGNTYRYSVYYNDSAPPSTGKITYHWYYHI